MPSAVWPDHTGESSPAKSAARPARRWPCKETGVATGATRTSRLPNGIGC
jgi:hypothetical protein